MSTCIVLLHCGMDRIKCKILSSYWTATRKKMGQQGSVFVCVFERKGICIEFEWSSYSSLENILKQENKESRSSGSQINQSGG